MKDQQSRWTRWGGLALALILIAVVLLAVGAAMRRVPPELSHPAVSPPASTPSAAAQETGVPADLGINFGTYEDVLSEEEQAALSRFYPVLLEGGAFFVGDAPYREEGWTAEETTLERFRRETESMAMYAEPPKISSFTLCDMDQDGERELILAFDNIAGTFLILHEGEDAIQGVVMYVRGLQMLQTNGIFNGSGGAGSNARYRMTFKDGAVQIVALAREECTFDEERFWLGEEEVTSLEYTAWIEEHTPGEVPWYS